jgi:AraC family transcriptional regulator
VEYKEHIQKAIDYIEQNLACDINLSDLAKVSGYSLYHFTRIFKEATKLTPADYIRKRRITEIIKQMSECSDCISDIAFSFGFNSKENFVRAFKAEHHVLPTEYKTAKSSLKLYEKISYEIKPISITPELAEIDAFLLTVYPCDEPYVPNFWNKYNCKKLSAKLTGGKECEDYGVSIFNGKLDYYIGVRSEQANGDLVGTINLSIPKGLYAIFETPQATHFDFVNTIHRTWEYIGSVWLPNSKYERRFAPEFETYIENSRSFKEKIFIPIQKRSD